MQALYGLSYAVSPLENTLVGLSLHSTPEIMQREVRIPPPSHIFSQHSLRLMSSTGLHDALGHRRQGHRGRCLLTDPNGLTTLFWRSSYLLLQRPLQQDGWTDGTERAQHHIVPLTAASSPDLLPTSGHSRTPWIYPASLSELRAGENDIRNFETFLCL